MPARRLASALLPAMACAAIVAGCGGSDDSGSKLSNPGQAVNNAKDSIDKAVNTQGLDKGAADKLKQAIQKAKNGDKAGAQKLAREACIDQAKARLGGDKEQSAIKICNSGAITQP